MKIQNLLLLTAGMLSSALTWAANTGDLVSMSGSSSEWDVVDPHVPKNSTSDEMSLIKYEGDPVGGVLQYRIHVENGTGGYYSGYEFPIEITADSQCLIDGATSKELQGNLSSPYKYIVSVSSAYPDGFLQCDVKVTDSTPMITPEHFQSLNIGAYMCEEGSVDVQIGHVESFKVSNGVDTHYLAVLVQDTSNECIRAPGYPSDLKGIHLYKWSQIGDDMGYEHHQFVSAADLAGLKAPSVVEYFEAGNVLVIGQYSNNNYKSPKESKVYQFNFENGKIITSSAYRIDQCSQDKGDYAYCGVNDLKILSEDGQHYLMTVNGGDRRESYTRWSTLQKWDGGKFGGLENEPILTKAGYAATYFTDGGEPYVFVSNRNTESSPKAISQLYKFKPENPTKTLEGIDASKMTTHMLHGVEHFTINGHNYFLFANKAGESNEYSKHVLYEFSGGVIKPVLGSTAYPIPNVTSWKHLAINGGDYFLATHPDENRTLFYNFCNNNSICPALVDTSKYRLVGVEGTSWDSVNLKDIAGTENEYLIQFDKFTKTEIGVQIIKLAIK